MDRIERYIALFAPYVTRYGYFVAFFGMMLENAGIPVPAETAVIVLAVFAGRGVLNIWLVIPIAIAGDVAGDALGYAIGRYGGRPLVERYGHYVGIHKEHIEKAEELFAKRGWQAVFLSQFYSVTRTTIALVAGASRMRFPIYIIADVAAASILITTVGLAAFYFSQNLEVILRLSRGVRVLGAVALVIVIAFYIYGVYRQSGKADRRTTFIIIGAAAAIIALILFVALATGYLS